MTLIDSLAATIHHALDNDEREATEQLCTNCGQPTTPIRNALGITGYTHGRTDRDWQGKRCPGRFTGAETVQRPERALADIAMRRELLNTVLAWKHGAADDGLRYRPCEALAEPAGACDCGLDERVIAILTLLAKPHPGGS